MKYKVGDKLLCKCGIYSVLKEGEWYEIEEIKDGFYHWIRCAWFTTDRVRSKYGIDKYFYNKNEIRKLKLDAIKNRG